MNVLNGVMSDLLILKTNIVIKQINKIKKLLQTLDYRGINFPMKARDYEIVEERFNINVNVFGYGNKIKCIINKQ